MRLADHRGRWRFAFCLGTAPARITSNSIIYIQSTIFPSAVRGSVHAVTESDVCIFCHTPHHASGDGPLWNHQMSGASYTPYSSSTLKATVGQPTGSSRLCLSCHDGTVALGLVHSRGSAIANEHVHLPPASAIWAPT